MDSLAGKDACIKSGVMVALGVALQMRGDGFDDWIRSLEQCQYLLRASGES